MARTGLWCGGGEFRGAAPALHSDTRVARPRWSGRCVRGQRQEELPMLRVLVCAGLALVVGSGAAFAEDKKDKGSDMRGQIVRVDPAGNTIVVRVGTGDAAKE